jgi:hypothetical protein
LSLANLPGGRLTVQAANRDPDVSDGHKTIPWKGSVLEEQEEQSLAS